MPYIISFHAIWNTIVWDRKKLIWHKREINSPIPSNSPHGNAAAPSRRGVLVAGGLCGTGEITGTRLQWSGGSGLGRKLGFGVSSCHANLLLDLIYPASALPLPHVTCPHPVLPCPPLLPTLPLWVECQPTMHSEWPSCFCNSCKGGYADRTWILHM